MEQPKERKKIKKDKKGKGKKRDAKVAELSNVEEVPLFPVKKVVLSKTGIGYFERYARPLSPNVHS
jgi:hypothetical protein